MNMNDVKKKEKSEIYENDSFLATIHLNNIDSIKK
jgi:hypothetical protein